MNFFREQSRRSFSLSLLTLLGGNLAFAWDRGKMARADEADKRDEITVRTVEEFFSAIAPNRTIKLQQGSYLLSTLNPAIRSEYAKFAEVFDGYELIVSGVENLKIVGLGNPRTRLLTQPRYAEVLRFHNCHNIAIANIEAGHSVEQGYCQGGVFYFADSNIISIDRCRLFGSGTVGLTAIRIQELSCQNTEITNCTYHGLIIVGCNEVRFENCQWTNNGEFDLINIANSQNIRFINCEFRNNSSNISSYTSYMLFNIQNSTFFVKDNNSVLLQGCRITENNFAQFSDSPWLLELVNTRLENNSFPAKLEN